MRRCSSRVALLVSLIAFVAASHAQSPTAALSSATTENSALVTIPISVTDPGERPVLNLEKQNFTVFEDNHRQSITSFSSDDAPASIGILLDLSASMRERDAILQFLQSSNPHDEFFLIGFNDHSEILADFPSSAADVQSKLSAIQAGHRTAIFDAVCLALEKMQHARYGRKALLIVSDGGDNNSKHSEHDVHLAARRADLPVYSLAVVNAQKTLEERNGAIFLDELSDESGGEALKAVDPSSLQSLAARISIELRTEYVITFRSGNPGSDGKWRKLKIKLQPPPGSQQLTVHARTGYYASLQ